MFDDVDVDEMVDTPDDFFYDAMDGYFDAAMQGHESDCTDDEYCGYHDPRNRC